jgi:adenosylhomocysteine nucleosidase
MKRLAIIAALPGELQPLVRGWRRESRPGAALWRTGARGREVWAGCGGIGAGAAERTLAAIEADEPVDGIVSAGWAGALRPEFAEGHAYAVGGVIDAATGERFHIGSPPELCWLVSTDRMADAAEKRGLANRFGAGLVDMEAAALARIAARRGLAFSCVKAVSDGADSRLPSLQGCIDEKGRFRLSRLFRLAAFRPALWPAFLHVGRVSRVAARSLAQSLAHVVQA